MAKRSDYISWDEYFMGVAILAAQRSKDPNTMTIKFYLLVTMVCL